VRRKKNILWDLASENALFERRAEKEKREMKMKEKKKVKRKEK
jgi:hypothetical protein